MKLRIKSGLGSRPSWCGPSSAATRRTVIGPSTTGLAQIPATPLPGSDFNQVVGHHKGHLPPKGHGLAQIGQRRESVLAPPVVIVATHIDRDYGTFLDPEYIGHTEKPVINPGILAFIGGSHAR